MVQEMRGLSLAGEAVQSRVSGHPLVRELSTNVGCVSFKRVPHML